MPFSFATSASGLALLVKKYGNRSKTLFISIILNIKKIRRNIFIGKNIDINDKKSERIKSMILLALGQRKMFSRPASAAMHILVYVGFVLINIEVIEMFVDGIFNTHRSFHALGKFYNFLIGFFEILALGVFIGVVVFWLRRNVLKIKRFMNAELNGWPKLDANTILIAEMFLMTALILMNAADQNLQLKHQSFAKKKLATKILQK